MSKQTRFWTNATAEQKERMVELAERHNRSLPREAQVAIQEYIERHEFKKRDERTEA